MKRFAFAVFLAACGGSQAAAPPPPVAQQATPAPESSSTPDDAGAATGSAPAPAASASASAAESAPAAAAAPAPAADDAPDSTMSDVYTESVNAFFKSKKETLTKACWIKSKSSEKAYAGKAVIRVGDHGKVASTKTEGTDEKASACIDKQIKTWKFPPPNGTATVTMPIRLKRD